MALDYHYTESPSYHIKRRKQLNQKYGEKIKELSRPNPWTALIIVAMVSTQFFLAYQLKSASWWAIVLLAYLFGAFMSHGLYVLIHEACHNLVFKSRTANKFIGLLCDFCLVIPSALGFRKYHMYHHRNLGDYTYDPDVTMRAEAKFIGNNWFKKTLWITFFMISQCFRPMKMKNVKLMNPWIAANIFIIMGINIAIVYFWGIQAFAYLGLSTFFGLGLHPLGGRWIQEHYVTEPNQETYSYYGPLNLTCFNMGYHNEHHDLMNVPWNNLPKVKAMAPEFYDNLKSYNSWTKVLLNFIFSKELSTFSRIVHVKKESV